MGLKVLDNVKRVAKPDLEVDISSFVGSAATLRFREPRAADLFPATSTKRLLESQFGEFPDDMIDQIILMSKTYIPDEDEDEITPSKSFALLARNHRDCFLHIMLAHMEAFRQDDIDKEVTKVGNASTE